MLTALTDILLLQNNSQNEGIQILFDGPDYMSRAGSVSRAASVYRDDFQDGIT